ncbi:hypothetical protein Rhal01_03384 [Rubritalea halochordaticola]|uniref:Sulfatase N-terminal domain-containing protein n=1 Tax=Rubritalea halochordaticola TaxID=714537 RepID=A0ABP9V756_9BACT
MKNSIYTFIVTLLCAVMPAVADTLISSNFDANTGAAVLTGDLDNSTGSASVNITDWVKDPRISSVSGLTAISPGGGFAVARSGSNVADEDMVVINHNLNISPAASKRGFSVNFTVDSGSYWDLTSLVVKAGHTSSSGAAQVYASDLNYTLSGGSLISPVTGSVTESYGDRTLHSISFDLTGTTIEAGEYTLEITMNNLSSGGAYASFDGITLTGQNDLPSLPEIHSFTADKSYATAGSTINLLWETSDATSLSITPGPGDVTSVTSNGDGSTSVVISETTTFTLSATNDLGTVQQTLEILSGPARPNIVLFVVDDFGPHDTSVPFNLDSGGNPVAYNFNEFYQTPNMEVLASQGMRFTSAYAQTVCSPTRCGIMTGRNSARHGVSDWVGGGGSGSPANWRSGGIGASDVTLPELLGGAGYRTIHVGKGHFAQTSVDIQQDIGFDVNIAGGRWGHPPSNYIGTAGYGGLPGLEGYDGSFYLTRALSMEANKAVENAVNEGRPFFLHMSFYAVHAPFTTNPDASGDYSSAVNNTHASFATQVEGMDIAVGAIRQKLIDLGVAEDTFIILVGDNGSDSPATTVNGLPGGSFSDWPMRGKKGSKWEGGSRIPMIGTWALPDSSNTFQQALPIPANSVETDIVTTWDIPTTLLGVAGVDTSLEFGEDGHDLSSYLSGAAGSHRPQEIVVHYPHNHRSDYFSWIRQGDMKLIYNYQTNSHELYNLANDPTETTDLASSEPETTMKLARALAQKLDATWGSAGVLKPTISTSAPNGNVISIPNDPSVDVDEDGLADTNEDPDLDGLIDAGETNPDNENTDGDSTNDGDELRTGTDPLSGASDFLGTLSGDSLQGWSVTWPSKPGANYSIYSSDSLTTWPETPIATVPAAAAGSSTSYILPQSSDPQRFYRVVLSP